MVVHGHDERGGKAEACLWEHAIAAGRNSNNQTRMWEVHEDYEKRRPAMENELADATGALLRARNDRDNYMTYEAAARLRNIPSKTDLLWEYKGREGPKERMQAGDHRTVEPFRFKHELALWRSPRRDVMLAAGVLCIVAKKASIQSQLGEKNLAILREVFATALDPHAPCSLDDVGERILSMVSYSGERTAARADGRSRRRRRRR